MEVTRTIGGVIGTIQMLVNLIAKNRELAEEVATDLESMKKDFEILISLRIVGKDDDQLQQQLTSGMQLQLQELAYDIDDFIQDLWVPGLGGSFILIAIGVDSRPLLIQRVKAFKERVTNLKGELPKSYESIPRRATSSPAGPSSSSAGSAYTPEKHLVGIHGPKMEIKQLLSRHVKPHDGRSGVISIVGRSGSGKTALAWAIYKDAAITEEFDYALWVVASDHKPADILNKILKELPQPHFRKDRRYLVIVDDVRQGKTCAGIKEAFHENVMDSRIIVTTRVPSVAMKCSSGSFVYTMQGLDKQNSIELLCRKFWGKDGYSEEDKYRLGNKGVDFIVDKCDGLPIALISAAECLRGKNIEELKHSNFITVSQELGDTLACSESDFELYKRRNGDETTFMEMRRAFVEPYENLQNNGEKDCLLYVSMFPNDYPMNSKSLVRILIAEGLVPGDPREMKDSELVVSDVSECLRMLMDQRMIDPVPIRRNCNAAKRCRVHSIMLQFTIKKAVSRNLVSLIQEGKSQYSTAGRVRRLTFQSSSVARRTGPPKKMDLSVLRSLAIFETGIVNFQKCKLVRVLNLEGCSGLTSKDLDNICGLLFLKYLSLRKTGIQELPDKVKNLQCLETLDTRETVVLKLPVEVIMLPRFAYLFGKFELTNVGKKKEELIKFFSEESELHTLGGIAVHEEKGLEIVLLVVQHAKKLKKVKVWYRNTPAVGGTPKLILFRRRIHKMNPSRLFSKPKPSTPEPFPCVSTLAETLKKRYMYLESVSVDFNGVPNTFLDFIQNNGTISSIKLWRGQGSLLGADNLRNEGSLKKLGNVSNLKKLHLFSTGLKSKQLATLQHLKCLQYLKLAEEGHGLWDSVFHVQARGFISLIWLCFESSNSKPPPLKIVKGATTPLTSLLLLCKESHPRVEGISHLAKLNEVILDPSASDDEVTAWKEEAKKQINRPYVEKQQV